MYKFLLAVLMVVPTSLLSMAAGGNAAGQVDRQLFERLLRCTTLQEFLNSTQADQIPHIINHRIAAVQGGNTLLHMIVQKAGIPMITENEFFRYLVRQGALLNIQNDAGQAVHDLIQAPEKAQLKRIVEFEDALQRAPQVVPQVRRQPVAAPVVQHARPAHRENLPSQDALRKAFKFQEMLENVQSRLFGGTESNIAVMADPWLLTHLSLEGKPLIWHVIEEYRQTKAAEQNGSAISHLQNLRIFFAHIARELNNEEHFDDVISLLQRYPRECEELIVYFERVYPGRIANHDPVDRFLQPNRVGQRPLSREQRLEMRNAALVVRAFNCIESGTDPEEERALFQEYSWLAHATNADGSTILSRALAGYMEHPNANESYKKAVALLFYLGANPETATMANGRTVKGCIEQHALCRDLRPLLVARSNPERFKRDFPFLERIIASQPVPGQSVPGQPVRGQPAPVEIAQGQIAQAGPSVAQPAVQASNQSRAQGNNQGQNSLPPRAPQAKSGSFLSTWTSKALLLGGGLAIAATLAYIYKSNYGKQKQRPAKNSKQPAVTA